MGPRAVLEAAGIPIRVELRGVGENLVDHAAVSLPLIANPGVCDARQPFGHVIARYTASGSAIFNDMQAYLFTHVDFTRIPEMVAAGLTLAPVLTAVLQKPETRGRLWIESAAPERAPRAEFRYASDAEDMRRLVDAVRFLAPVARQPALTELSTGALPPNVEGMSDDALADFIRASVISISHAAVRHAWDAPATRWRSSIPGVACTASKHCASPTHPSCRRSRARTPISPAS